MTREREKKKNLEEAKFRFLVQSKKIVQQVSSSKLTHITHTKFILII